MVEHISETMDERYDEDSERWYCFECGKGHEDLGQIAGTNVKCCEGCGTFSKVLRKYRWLQ